MLAALKRNEKGLTLIELLAVLVIVAIIAAIAIPAIGGTITKSKENADIASVKMIEEATLRYLIDTNAGASTTDVPIADLVSKGYLNGEVDWQVEEDRYDNVKTTLDTTNGTWVIKVEKKTTT